MQKYTTICEKQQIMREYAINDKICENMRDFEKYAKSHVSHLNSAPASVMLETIEKSISTFARFLTPSAPLIK